MFRTGQSGQPSEPREPNRIGLTESRNLGQVAPAARTIVRTTDESEVSKVLARCRLGLPETQNHVAVGREDIDLCFDRAEYTYDVQEECE